MDDSNDRVEKELLVLLEHLNDSMSILENLDENNRDALVNSVEGIVHSFQKLHELEPEVTGTVPRELIEQIDQHKKTKEFKYEKECLLRAKLLITPTFYGPKQ